MTEEGSEMPQAASLISFEPVVYLDLYEATCRGPSSPLPRIGMVYVGRKDPHFKCIVFCHLNPFLAFQESFMNKGFLYIWKNVEGL